MTDKEPRPHARNPEETLEALRAELADHKRTVQELATATARTNAILDVAVDGILSIDETGTIESVNPAVGRMFGYKPHELLGRNVRVLMPAPFGDEHDGYLERYRRTGERRIIGIGREVQGLRRGGGVFPLELAVSEGFDGTRRFFTGMVRDLSERDEARRAQASLAAILEDSLNEIFVFHGETLRFLQVNRGARKNLGYSMKELEDLTPVDIKPELSAAEFHELIAPLRTGEKSILLFETVHARKDGTRYSVDVHLQRASYGGEPAFVALIFDMTERKEALEALKQSEERARAAEQLASIATLTAGIAHDIGTPMNIILGYAQMLQRSVDAPKDRERLETIVEQVKRITDLVRTLLNMARPHDAILVPLDLATVLGHGLDFFQEKMKKHDVVVERHFDSVPTIRGDSDRLDQVFLNLFVNAVDAMPDGGTLRVDLSAPEPTQIEIRVSDTGSGIPADLLERIFEPFVTSKERDRGTGLGLAVASGIVVDHGGTIEASSAPGKGTSFCLRFPVEVEL